MATNAKRLVKNQTPANIRADLTFEAGLLGHNLKFATTWGLFSPRTIDEGTELLVKYLEPKPTDDCLDLGCGYGPIGLLLAKMAPEGTTHLVDKDFVAVEYAAKNATLNGLTNTQSYLSNGFSHVPAEQLFDVIASNIPAKIGSEQLQIFLDDAYAHLKPGGQLYVVTISGLKEFMKRHLEITFGTYDKLGQSRTYTAAVTTKSV